jgi:ubiquinone/menaquinone biosynthesis C-methylase UbiE
LYEARTPVGELLRRRQELVLESLAGTPGGRLLDAGCGAGLMSESLLRHRPDDFAITALDRSEAMIDAARSNIRPDMGVRFVVGRIETMPLEDAFYDVALALGVLEYVVDVPATIRELARVVKPGGVVIASMQNPVAPFRLWERHVFPGLARLRGSVYDVEERLVGERRLRGMLQDSGLGPVDVVYYNFNLFPMPFDNRYPKQAIRLARRLAPLGRGPLRKLAADLLITARRLDSA